MLVAVLLAAAWMPPVPGAVVRGFDFGGERFAPGRHRGVDFDARRGAPVRAACGGRVVVARRIGSSGGVVTVACGRWRVSHLPLATIQVREGDVAHRGARLGTAAGPRDSVAHDRHDGGHAGLHLGVRRDGRPNGYVDPLAFLTGPPAAPPPAGPRGEPRRTRTPANAPRRPAAPTSAPAPAAAPFAPWPAWAGLALVLAGAAGAAGAARRRVRSPGAASRAARRRATVPP
jgi:hypothetical protein